MPSTGIISIHNHPWKSKPDTLSHHLVYRAKERDNANKCVNKWSPNNWTLRNQLTQIKKKTGWQTGVASGEKTGTQHETLGVFNGEPYLSTVVKTYSCTGEYECPNGAHEAKQHIYTEYKQNKIRKTDLKTIHVQLYKQNEHFRIDHNKDASAAEQKYLFASSQIFQHYSSMIRWENHVLSQAAGEQVYSMTVLSVVPWEVYHSQMPNCYGQGRNRYPKSLTLQTKASSKSSSSSSFEKLKLSTVCDNKLFCRFASLGAELSHLLHDIHALLNPSESHVFEVEVLCLLKGDEELWAVSVTPTIGHWQNAGACVLDVKVLVLKLAAIDGLASCSIALGDIATLKDQWDMFELCYRKFCYQRTLFLLTPI